MVTLDLRDTKIVENYKAIQELRNFGFTDEEIQKLYDKQVELDEQALKGGVQE